MEGTPAVLFAAHCLGCCLVSGYVGKGEGDKLNEKQTGHVVRTGICPNYLTR